MTEHASPPKFTWKDHLLGIWSIMSANTSLNLRMRVKMLESRMTQKEWDYYQLKKRESRNHTLTRDKQ